MVKWGVDDLPWLLQSWFDRVLVDLGDSQSLEQSLSTFSGHIRRLRNILAAMTPRSLVLLDEVGSGTDPTEGAALAVSLLTRFAVRPSAICNPLRFVVYKLPFQIVLQTSSVVAQRVGP